MALVAVGLLALAGAVAATRVENGLSPAALGYRLLGERDIRLATIGYRIARANAPFCRLTSANPGWVIHDIAQYGDADAAREAFDFPEPVSVMALVDGAPAALAGVEAGDGLIGWKGVRIDAENRSAARMTSERIDTVRENLRSILEAKEGTTLMLATRDGIRSIALRPEPVCKSDFWVDARDKRDAGADGERVRVTSGLIDYTNGDDELAAVVAHEMAHNLLEHRKRIDGARSSKTKIIKETEAEADRLSVWLMANAGYDPEAAISFWQRYGKETGLGIFSAPTHYRWQRRVAMLREEIIRLNASKVPDGKIDPPLLAAQRAAG